jgi:hypothetical protein
MNQEFPTKAEFKKWLKSITFASLVSLSVITDVGNTTYQFSNLSSVKSAIEADFDGMFPEGSYLTTTAKTVNNDDSIVYSEYLLAMTIKLRVADARSPSGELPFGEHDILIKKLADYEYVSKTPDENFDQSGHIWVRKPANPLEAENLIAILKEHSTFYAVPDGSDTINLNNLRTGNGFKFNIS